MRALLCLMFGVLLAAPSLLAQKADCNAPAPQPITYVSLPAHPFSTVATQDGCWVFVSLTSADPKSPNGVAVMRRAAGNMTLERVVPVETSPTGMVLTHDERVLIVADDEYVVFLDVARMTSGQGEPLLGFMSDGQFPGSVYVNTTADDKFLFVSDEYAQAITVIDLRKAAASNYDKSAIVGRVPVGDAPIALTFSPDQKWLYTTSQIAPKDWKWPIECKRESRRDPDAKPENPAGAIIVLDVAKATVDPKNSIVARVPAGCSPVRLAITPKGDAVWITARNSNALMAFDTARILAGAENPRIGSVPVGPAPVGIAIVHRGKHVVSTNSNRFAPDPNAPQKMMVIDADKAREGEAAVIGTIQAGAFPREFGQTADGKTLFVANYLSNNIEVIDLERFPVEAKQK